MVVRGITIPFREVQRFMQRTTTGATATEIRVKNAIRFLLDSGVRIVLVLSVAYSALLILFPSRSAPDRRRAARGDYLLRFCDFSCWHIFFIFGLSFVVVRAITIPFREVQRFMQRATTGATATEIRVKNQ